MLVRLICRSSYKSGKRKYWQISPIIDISLHTIIDVTPAIPRTAIDAARRSCIIWAADFAMWANRDLVTNVDLLMSQKYDNDDERTRNKWCNQLANSWCLV